MRPAQIAFISLVLGLSIAAGAFAAVRTVHLGAQASTASATREHKLIVQRTHQLDRFEASLRTSLGKRPPKLPRLPHFKPIAQPAAAAAAAPSAAIQMSSAAPAQAQAPRVVYVQPHHVITIHRPGGAHEQDGGQGAKGGHDD